MESRVLFSPAVSSIIQHDISKNAVFLEVGPHSALAGPLRQIQANHSTSLTYISALVRHENDVESFLTYIGKLFTVNIEVDLTNIIAKDNGISQGSAKNGDTASTSIMIFWEFEFQRIRDHRVGDDIVFLFAGYAGMMGEAVRQVTHVDEAFKLRNVTVSTAPVLNECKPVEIMTTLHRKRLTNNLDSEWWEVTIASYNGAVWTKHCSGEARSYGESLGDAGTKAPFLRKVGTRRCYESMARSGLNFGPEFQRLDQIKADTQEQRADAKVAAKHGDNVDYHLHPTIIDATLQLLRVVAS
ncbi:uncharacterized protein FFB14_13563 [Fusarium fujikuroi]|nr:uncharacterized protein FFB14_13563 [Fusarium fujikuroi]